MWISKMLGTLKAKKRKTEVEVYWSESLNTFSIILSGIQSRTPPLLLAQNEQSWGTCPRLSDKLKHIFKSSLSLSFSYFSPYLILQFSEVNVMKGQKYRVCYLQRKKKKKKVATILFWPRREKKKKTTPRETSFWNKTRFSQSSGADVLV